VENLMTNQNFDELISLVEGAAPSLAKALLPGPVGSVAQGISTVAIGHIAQAFGLPHPATADEVTVAIQSTPMKIAETILQAADIHFLDSIGAIAPQPAAQEPTTNGGSDSRPPAPHAGIVMDPITMIIFMILSMLSGVMMKRGIDINGLVSSLTGSPDMQAGAAVLAGSLWAMLRHVTGSNANTLAISPPKS
jgi:hypothetical protein